MGVSRLSPERAASPQSLPAAAALLPLVLLVLAAPAARAQANQWTACQNTGTCVSYTLSLTNIEPSTFWSLGTTLPFNLAVAAALNDPANGVNLGDTGTFEACSQDVLVGNCATLIQRMDTGDIILRSFDPSVPGYDANAGSFNGPPFGPGNPSNPTAITNIYYQINSLTTAAVANLVGTRIAANAAKICASVRSQLNTATDPWNRGVSISLTLPVGFPSGPTPAPSALPSPIAGAAARTNVISFVFKVVGVSGGVLSSAAARHALEQALAAAIMVGPSNVGSSGSSGSGHSTGAAFDMSSIILTALTPVTLAVKSLDGAAVLYLSSAVAGGGGSGLGSGSGATAAGTGSFAWYASVTFDTPQTAFAVGKLLDTNVLQWAALLATEASAIDPVSFPAGVVTTGLAQPIMYPLGPSYSPTPSPSPTSGLAGAGSLSSSGGSGSGTSSSPASSGAVIGGVVGGLLGATVIAAGALWAWKSFGARKLRGAGRGSPAPKEVAGLNPLRV